MSDFLYGYQADEFVNGQYYNGDYMPTEQDYIDMNEQWGDPEFEPDYQETEGDVYQDAFYDQEPEDFEW